MARRKQRKPGSGAVSGDSPNLPSGGGVHSRAQTEAGPDTMTGREAMTLPSPALAGVISLLVVFHLFALFVSYSAIIEPSETHTKCLDSLAPYLRSTHFAADGRPYYLAHVTPDERPHRLQIAKRPATGPLVIDYQTDWATVDPTGRPGLAQSDRYGRWMKLVATLSQSDQPSLAAALLMPLIESDPSIEAVRIVRLPTELTTVEEDSEGPVYLARVVRDQDQIQLVAIEPPRLTTQQRATIPASSEATSRSGRAGS